MADRFQFLSSLSRDERMALGRHLPRCQPENLCLAGRGMGHDERAKKLQPVRSRLGERFLPWQLEQSVEDSWKECALHARNLLGADAFSRLQSQPSAPRPYADSQAPLPLVAETEAAKPARPTAQRRLFPGEKTLFGDTLEEDPPNSKKRSKGRP